MTKNPKSTFKKLQSACKNGIFIIRCFAKNKTSFLKTLFYYSTHNIRSNTISINSFFSLQAKPNRTKR